MNREKRIRNLRAIIDDPAAFEGERDNARRMLERLAAAPSEERGRAFVWTKESAPGTPVDVEFVWWDGRGPVPPMRPYGEPPDVRSRMSEDPPPRTSFDGFEVEFSISDDARPRFEEILRAFRRAAGDAEEASE